MSETLQLKIGGAETKDGWKVLDAKPGPGVDYVGDLRDLSQFAAGSCGAVYASHVLQTLCQSDILATLQGIRRVLTPGGKLMVSVPNLETLCRLFLHADLKQEHRFQVMQTIFGKQTQPTETNFVGFTLEILASYLREAGYVAAQQIQAFGLFQDASDSVLYGVPVSLNVVATTPR